MAARKYKGSSYLTDSQNSQLVQFLRENQECVVTGMAEVYANYISDRERRQHFRLDHYSEDGWFKYPDICAVCLIKDNRQMGFEIRIYSVEGHHVNLIAEMAVNTGFVSEFVPPGNIFVFGQIHQICLHFPHHNEGKHFHDQLVKVCKEWKLPIGAGHVGSGLVDHLATKIMRGKDLYTQASYPEYDNEPVPMQEYRATPKERKMAEKAQEKYNQTLGRVREIKGNVKTTAENVATDYLPVTSAAGVPGYIPAKLAAGKQMASDSLHGATRYTAGKLEAGKNMATDSFHGATRYTAGKLEAGKNMASDSLHGATRYTAGKLEAGKNMVKDHVPSPVKGYQRAKQFAVEEKTSLVDKVKKLLHKKPPDQSRW